LLIAAQILDSNVLIWRRGFQADHVGFNALLLWGGGCLWLITLPGKDYRFNLIMDLPDFRFASYRASYCLVLSCFGRACGWQPAEI